MTTGRMAGHDAWFGQRWPSITDLPAKISQIKVLTLEIIFNGFGSLTLYFHQGISRLFRMEQIHACALELALTMIFRRLTVILATIENTIF